MTDETVRAHLEGGDLQQAINDKKIFVEDLTFLDGVPTMDQCEVFRTLKHYSADILLNNDRDEDF